MTLSQHSGPQSRQLLAQIRMASGSLARWWLGEFLALFPPRIAQFLTDAGNRNLVIRPGAAEIEFVLRNEAGSVLARTKLPNTSNIRAAIDAMLRGRKLSAKDLAIGIELPPEKFFRREILLPQQARSSIPAIAAQDLSRKTPFRLDDVHHDYSTRPSGEKILVSQLIIRRDFVAEAAEALGLNRHELAFVETGPSSEGEQPSCLKLRQITPQASWLPKALIGLAGTAIILTGLAAMLESGRQQAMLDELGAQLTKARAQAQQVGAAQDKARQERSTLDQLRSRKSDAADTLDIWEELSRLLPDHSWLTELRIADSPDKKDRKALITGFSTAAADLVALIDKSPLFQDVALTAPISVDPVEQRERFVLQATITPPAAGAQR